MTAISSIIESVAAGKLMYRLWLAACIVMCTLCAGEGGLQLHLSHDHSALGCVVGYMSEGDNASAPPCKLPDERGEPWRLRLVELDLFGFIVFGTIGFALSDVRKTVNVAARRTA